MHFKEYNKDQLTEILKKRLREMPEFLNLFDENILHLIGVKTASHTPDARKAVQVARKCLSLAEAANFAKTHKYDLFSFTRN